MRREPNYYDHLGIPANATPEELRSAYREAALRLHPDTNVEPGATEMFLVVQEAYAVISDPVRRAAYDATLPPELFATPPVKLSALYSRGRILANQESQLIYTLLELKPIPDSQHASNKPLNICLVLDCSTSMQGEFLDTLKATSIELVHQLRSNDVLSVVSFNDRAQVVVPGGIRLERSEIENSIWMLNTGGGTEIYQGLKKGYDEISLIKRPDYINHLILVTDGHTYGDEEACLEIGRQAQIEQIGISALGIGNKWNDEFLDSLTSLTGGTSFYVREPEDIRKFLKEKLYKLGQSFANQIIFKYEKRPNVDLQYAFRLQPEAAPLEIGTQMILGSLPREDKLLILLEFLIQDVPSNIEELELVNGRINFNIPGSSKFFYSQTIRLVRPVNLEPDTELPPLAIIQALSKLTFFRLQEKARGEIDAGNIEAATSRMQFLATNLLANGEEALARTAMREAANIRSMGGLSEEGKKQIKYGTRALLPLNPPSISGETE
jgi:Ca-activated chloride channel family protein